MIRFIATLYFASSLFAAAPPVPLWARFERAFQSTVNYTNPVQAVDFRVEFRSASGIRRVVYGFWDGDRTWRARFVPVETGIWTYRTMSSDPANKGLADVSGSFVCGPARNDGSVFERHGPVEVSNDGRHLSHADGTPFFFLADTAWSGPLLSTPEDWSFYIKTRAGQKFTAIQWAATQWRGAPKGDNAGRLAYSGVENIALNLDYFRRLDQKSAALNQAGLLSVPVMLWAFDHSAEDQVSPGVSLPDAQAIVLARYMMGRWGADAVLWLLNGDGDYRGPKAERWRNIGRAVFQEVWHAPVSLHPGGGIWVMDNFRDESWISVSGYQSGHNDSEKNSRWITSGEPAVDWKRDRAHTSISLEGPYESPARPDRTPAPDFLTRRNHYWSLLNAPTAGITYGVSGVWSWSDGTCPVPGHGPVVGPHWKTVLHLPAAEQMRYLAEFFQGIDYWRLRPEPAVLGAQPGVNAIGRFISAAQSPEKNLTVLYIPEDRSVTLVSTAVPARFSAEWFNPRTGDRSTASAEPEGLAIQFLTPAAGDWLLLLRAK